MVPRKPVLYPFRGPALDSRGRSANFGDIKCLASLELNAYPVFMKKEGKVVETDITFHNETELKVQAQIYSGRMLISTCVVNPGKVQILPANSLRFDIFFKNGTTGWEIARKLDSDANNFTLSKFKNRYTVVETKDSDTKGTLNK